MLKNPAKILLAILLTTGIGTLLSGCLVEKKDPADIETISRNGVSNWRIYQDGDLIDYNLQVEDHSTFPPTITQGILRVQWESTANITDPTPPNDPHSVLKETTTITYDDNTSGNPDITIIRYISQISDPMDPNYGRILLHAIDDGSESFWPYDSTIGSPDATFAFPTSDPVFTPTLFDSPMATGVVPENNGKTISITECDSGQCNDIYQYQDTSIDVVGDSTSIDTPLGTFSNPFQINFGGHSNPRPLPTISFVGDIRDVCSTIDNYITHGTRTGVGNLYVFPEIGIIRIENACTVGSDTTIYYATIRSTNFY